MSCDKVRVQLTAYLDGELADERGSAVRGHLRGCAACRQVASDEALLRDGLRALPPVDPSPSLWAGVQAQLAVAEAADAERPAWRRMVARWMPKAPQLAFGSAVVAAAVVLLVIRAQQTEDTLATRGERPMVSPATRIDPVIVASDGTSPPPVLVVDDDTRDVSEVLAAAPAQVSEEHAAVVRELVPIAREARAQWTDAQRREFDERLAELQAQVTSASTERIRQRHYRAVIRYLQRAAIRDDVALASLGGAP